MRHSFIGRFSNLDSPLRRIPARRKLIACLLAVILISLTPAAFKSANTVLIFTYTDAQFYVNGKAIGPVGKLGRSGDQIYLCPTIVDRIRPALARRPSRPAPRPAPRSRLVVVDPGHGGKDPGATAVNGVHEKTVNLDVALFLADLLRARGIEVLLTRSDDTYIELEERAELANRRNAALFVSIHADSAPSARARGYTVYTSRSPSSQSDRLAKTLARAMGRTGLDSRGVRRANYRVLVTADCPAVLVEMGYLSNGREADMLTRSDFQRRLAVALAEGISEHIGL